GGTATLSMPAVRPESAAERSWKSIGARSWSSSFPPVIEHCYGEFLLQNHDPDEREYPAAADQIREVLIHENYLSQGDIDICLGFYIAGIADRQHPRAARSTDIGIRNRR
ncbi:MAG: hypothetical protein KJ936_06990, partial [Proteobacteria bacterium]|nr:hypothetical protein [Pseudomonadota bacterium]